jgi:hypothetical protein
MPRPCHSSQGHGTSWPSRKSLWTKCQRSASSGYHAEFHEVVIRRIPISDAGGQCETKHCLLWTMKRVVAAHYKKDDLLHCGLAVGYFWLPCGHSRTRHCRSRAGARHGMCELTHGMAGERYGRGMLCVNPPLWYSSCGFGCIVLFTGSTRKAFRVETTRFGL